MRERSGFPSASDSTARVLLVAVCAGIVVLSMVAPVAHSMHDPAERTVSPTGSTGSSPQAGTAPNTTDFPPGTSASGIDNVSRLTEAHRSELNDSTYRSRVEWDHISVWSSTGYDVTHIAVAIASGPDSALVRYVSGAVVNTHWVTDDATAARTSFGPPPLPAYYHYGNSASGRESQYGTSEILHDWLNSSTYDYTGTVTRDNRTLYEFRSAGLRGNTTPIVDARARVLVDRDGVIHDADVTRTYRFENETVTGRLDHDLRRTGTTPPTRPRWVTAKLPHLDASVVGNGTVIEIEHTGGQPISNATVRTFFPDGQDFDTAIEGFEPGETLYLYRTESAPERLLVSENEAPEVNESFVPVGEEFVLVSAFVTPTSIFGPDDVLIEVEPRDR